MEEQNPATMVMAIPLRTAVNRSVHQNLNWCTGSWWYCRTNISIDTKYFPYDGICVSSSNNNSINRLQYKLPGNIPASFLLHSVAICQYHNSCDCEFHAHKQVTTAEGRLAGSGYCSRFQGLQKRVAQKPFPNISGKADSSLFMTAKLCF